MKKGFIIAIVVLLVYLVLMIVLFSNENPDNPTKQEKQTIKNHFEYEKGGIIAKKITANNTGINKIKEQLQLVGITGYDSFKPVNYTIKRLNQNNIDYFKKYVSTENDLANLTVNQKIEFDFDNDGDLEQLLLISNVNDTNAKKWFTSVYYIDKRINKIKLIEYSKFDQDNIKFEISNIVDMNDDNMYEILLKMSPDVGECYDIYTLKEGIYKSVVLCDRPTV